MLIDSMAPSRLDYEHVAVGKVKWSVQVHSCVNVVQSPLSEAMVSRLLEEAAVEESMS